MSVHRINERDFIGDEAAGTREDVTELVNRSLVLRAADSALAMEFALGVVAKEIGDLRRQLPSIIAATLQDIEHKHTLKRVSWFKHLLVGGIGDGVKYLVVATVLVLAAGASGWAVRDCSAITDRATASHGAKP